MAAIAASRSHIWIIYVSLEVIVITASIICQRQLLHGEQRRAAAEDVEALQTPEAKGQQGEIAGSLW